MLKETYSVEQLHRCDWTDEDCSETPETSFDEDEFRTKETWTHIHTTKGIASVSMSQSHQRFVFAVWVHEYLLCECCHLGTGQG